MVTIERQVGGLIRYRKVWYSDHEAALEIARSMYSNHLVRLFGASVNPNTIPHLVSSRHMRTAWVDLTATSEGILNGMRKKSCRYEIRRAERMLGRVDIETGTTRSSQDFLTVYNDFAKVKKLPAFRPSWLQEYAAHADIFVLYFEKRPLCCHLLLRDPDKRAARLLYSGSRRLQTAEDASACGPLNRYLHWHEMQHYKNSGYATFDFGGIRNPEDSITRFKLSFGGRVVTEQYCVLGGSVWLARLGNVLYEALRRRAPGPGNAFSTQTATVDVTARSPEMPRDLDSEPL